MLKSSSTKLSIATAVSLAVVSSLVGGLLLAYFTDLIFKPEVLYTVTGSEIKLPESYEKELSKARATALMKNFEAIVGTSKKQLTAELGTKGNKIGVKERHLEMYGPNLFNKNNNTITVAGEKLEQMVDTLEKPETLRALLDPTAMFPTAFATIEIYNTGNREASDLEINITPNGVVVEVQASSTEPSAEQWERMFDDKAGIPVGVHLAPIKRLPPGGKIQVKIYWHQMGAIDSATGAEDLTVSVKGSYSGGMLKYVEVEPSASTNWVLWAAVGIFIAMLSATLGFWIRNARNPSQKYS